MCCLRKRHQTFRITGSLRTVLCPVWGIVFVAKRAIVPHKFIGLSTVQNSPWEVTSQAGMLLSSPMSGKDVSGTKVAVMCLSSIYASYLPVGRCPQAGLERTYRSHLLAPCTGLSGSPQPVSKILKCSVSEDYLSIVKPSLFGVFFATAVN